MNPELQSPAQTQTDLTRQPLQFSLAVLWLALAGGLGGLVGHSLAGPFLTPFFNYSLASSDSWLRMLMGQALLTMFNGAGIGLALLMVDNATSLRGRWHRDLGRGTAIFLALAFGGGLVGQCVLSAIGLSRGVSWAIGGVCIGMGLGWVRRDKTQGFFGALGGFLGGFLGGLMVDGFLAASYTDAAFARASVYGVILTGALIGLLVRLVQDVMQDAWIMGITIGPYEGKRYPLGTQKVTVGKSELCDISLYRESELAVQSGAFENQSGRWFWRGDPLGVNGAAQTDTPLKSGDLLTFGATNFRFQTRKSEADKSLNKFQPNAAPIPVVATPMEAPAMPLSADVTPETEIPVAKETPVAGRQWVLVGTQGELKVPYANGEAVQEKSIGRALDNDFVLNDPSVSGHHARLRVRDTQLFLTDLNSTNGSKINGAAISPEMEMPLEEMTRVVLGESHFVVFRR